MDALLESLLVVASHLGRDANRHAAVAGLPLDKGRLSPSLFGRAAEQLGLKCKLLKCPLPDINQAVLPAVLLLKDNQAVVLHELDLKDHKALISQPDNPGQRRRVTMTGLSRQYLGHAFLLRRDFEFDERARALSTPRRTHWFWGPLLDNAPLYRDALVAALLINLFAVAIPLFVMNVYDRVVPNEAIETLWALALGVVVVLIGDIVLRSARAYFLDLAGNRIDLLLSARIMQRVLGMRLSARPPAAGAFAANLRSFETVRDFITSATVAAFVDVPFAFIFVALIAWIAPTMLIPLGIGALLVLLVGLAVQRPLRELTEYSYRTAALRNATLVEALVGLETIKSQSGEGLLQARWERAAAHLARIGLKLRQYGNLSLHITLWSQQLTSILVVVFGVYLVVDRELTMGGLIATMMLSARAMAPLGQVAGVMNQYHNARAALESLNEVMQGEQERHADLQTIHRGRLKGEIEFKGVSFAYPGHESAMLRDISFKLAAGEKIALLGRVGSGKSTLLRLILGLYQPDQGVLRLDGIDSRQLDPADLRAHIGYVPQDASLIYGSLRENLLLGRQGIDDEQLLRACHMAGIAEWVNAHPQGFGMPIGERGETLSGGQRQGIALARGLVAQPSMLLLDEPTGAMDFGAEQLVRERLADFARDRSVVLVTHRTALLSLVDRIIVMDEGRIVADGPKDKIFAALESGQIGRAQA